MSRQAWNFVLVAVVTLIALANPVYRYFSLHQPIVTLGLDLKGGVEVLLQAVPETGGKPTADQMNGVQEVVRNRVDPQGTKELTLTQVGLDRLLLQVPGEKNPDAIIEVIGDTALLEWINTGTDSFTAGTDFNVEGTNKRKPEYEKYEVLLTGAHLKKAGVQFDQTNRPMITFELDKEGGDIFGNFTNNHVGQYLTVLLDGKVVTSPVIKSAIWGGSGVIEGQFTLEEANKVVRQLNAGALPVPLTILSSSVVGPTLGQDSINASFIAGLIGFAIVLLFMIFFYRLPGVVANFTLILYVVLVLGYFSLINATMTLPGIAGFLLSIGMAIDANIIIFERLKEEVRWGKTLVVALEAAFARAWVAILDGNLTTMIAAAVLYMYGTGAIKGFAVTLIIGNLMALFTAVFVCRLLLNVVINWWRNPHWYAPVVKKLVLPMQLLRQGLYYRFVEKTAYWMTGSVVLIAIGLALGGYHVSQGRPFFRLGIDFTGGEKVILEASQEFPLDGQAVKQIVDKYSDGDPVVQVDATDPRIATIRMRVKASGATEDELSRSRTAALLAMKKDIGNAYGGFSEDPTKPNPIVREQNYVGPTVGRELIIKAIISLLLGSLLIMGYVLIRFGRWPMSVAAIISLIHDVAFVLAFTAAFQLEVNSSFIAVILTIIGYSINDTIIVFDRIRENSRTMGDSVDFAQLCNLSMSQTWLRSMNTVLTVVIMILALLFLGGANIRDFMAAMLIGIVSGCYSSIYIATPLMLWFSHGRLRLQPEAGGDVEPVDLELPEESEEEDFEQPAERGAGGEKKKPAKKQRRR